MRPNCLEPAFFFGKFPSSSPTLDTHESFWVFYLRHGIFNGPVCPPHSIATHHRLLRHPYNDQTTRTYISSINFSALGRLHQNSRHAGYSHSVFPNPPNTFGPLQPCLPTAFGQGGQPGQMATASLASTSSMAPVRISGTVS